MIRGSDGLDYEDLAARLIGEPAETSRNNILVGPFSDEFKAAYRETYDHYEGQGYPPLECHRAAFTQARDDRPDAGIWFANYAGKPGAGLTTGDFGVVTIDPDYTI